MTKLTWDYDQSSGEHHARIGEYRIRAVHDSTPQNPFTDGDCNWPIVVRSPDAFHDITCYQDGVEHSSAGGFKLDCSMFTDAALVHSQHHILKVLDAPTNDSPAAAMRNAMEAYLTEEPVGYCHDADVLRDLFDQMLSDRSMPDLLKSYEELCTIALVPAYRTTVTGYCQGDWAEVLVIATPEVVKRFGCTEPIEPSDLETTAKLYGWWAYGDVYGHIVERRCVGDSFDDDDGTDEEWEELDDGSCWGFYGPDHDQSGLEESALGCIPDEIMREAA